MSDQDEIVGHKTLSDGSGGYRHEPLTRGEADAMWAKCEAEDARRKAQMPTEDDARNALFDAWLRLKDFGWREAVYCPKDGSVFDVIECGSTGVHKCHYEGEWPKGSWWIHDEGDLWPSRPTLYRLVAAPAATEGGGQ